MSIKNIRFLFIPFMICLLSFSKTHGQGRGSDTSIVITDTTNIEALFKKARELSFDHYYTQARKICQKILEKKPTYYEVRTFLGRIYAWDRQYDAARTELSRVLIEKENDYEALSALFDVEFWTESYSMANDYLKVALGYYPTSEALLIKKAKLQIRLEEKNEAALTLRRILDLNPGQKEAISLMNSLEGRKLSNNFQTGYTVDRYDDNQPQSQVSVEYGHSFSFGSLTGRVNYGDRSYANGYQYELESYPHITKTTYLNLLVGFSEVSFYPKRKYTGEIYQKLPSGFELSAGMRYLQYSTTTKIYVASLSNYYKDYWFSVRTFITPKDSSEDYRSDKTSITVLAYIRKYFGDSDNYMGLRGGKGNSPDIDRKAIDPSSGDVIFYPTTQISFEFQKRAFARWLIKCDLTYARESPNKGQLNKRLSMNVTLKTVF